ncbi:Crp/Fnr family transcriptional regulator [Parvularcula sp. ZS-1/3]|uniref:Crp/Fnr family transcriptional regulator n=1 Tax=Parvularcula mediterranea TaxID=2732508 RepID=A0A7Y3W553_9PROT|nr:Crp/Fnr family transcriptional regulator [Parvularcula mediterranea]NNU16163.1 Crp/Fnr family transcriptional regulator [Parvularcula mediterranea]
MTVSVIEFGKRRTIFAAGDKAGSLPKLISGAAILYTILPDGRRQVLDLAGAGDFLHFETGGELDHFAEALTPCEVAFYDAEELLSDADMAGFLLEQMRDRLGFERRHITLLSCKSATERLAEFIDLAADCLGAENDVMNLPLTRQQIADFTGLTLETVSRTFAQWQRDETLTKVSAGTYRRGEALLAA